MKYNDVKNEYKKMIEKLRGENKFELSNYWNRDIDILFIEIANKLKGL